MRRKLFNRPRHHDLFFSAASCGEARGKPLAQMARARWRGASRRYQAKADNYRHSWLGIEPHSVAWRIIGNSAWRYRRSVVGAASAPKRSRRRADCRNRPKRLQLTKQPRGNDRRLEAAGSGHHARRRQLVAAAAAWQLVGGAEAVGVNGPANHLTWPLSRAAIEPSGVNGEGTALKNRAMAVRHYNATPERGSANSACLVQPASCSRRKLRARNERRPPEWLARNRRPIHSEATSPISSQRHQSAATHQSSAKSSIISAYQIIERSHADMRAAIVNVTAAGAERRRGKS